MTDASIYQCFGCGSPLLYGVTGLTCARGRIARVPTVGLRTGIDCTGEKKEQPIRTRPRNVEVFVCSCGCKRTVKLKAGETMTEERVCERGGLLVYSRTQSR